MKWKTEWVVASVALVLSLLATNIAYLNNWITLYGDAMAHLLIARRVIDGVTIGFGQLGSYWLPLPHLLTLLFVWNDSLYYSGVAGVWISMLSYILASVYLYKTTLKMTDNAVAGFIAVSIFMLNLNVLYMQSTTMTELLMIVTMLAATYHFLMWCHSDSLMHLSLSSVALLFAGFTRYEAWILTATFGLIMIYVAWRKKYQYHKFEASAVFWGSLAGLNVFLWSGWSWVIFGDPLDFHRGEYSNPSLWVGMADVYIGNWKYSILTYFYAMRHISGIGTMIIATIGLLYYLWKEKLGYQNVAALAILGQIVFFILMLYGAQRPLLVPEVSEGMYNIRFALVTIIPIAIFAGYLATISHKAKWILVPLTAILLIIHLQGETILLEEALAMDEDTPQTEVTWFGDHYESGMILGENVGNERLFYNGRIPLKSNIYEGSHSWDAALEDPLAYNVEWIIARHIPSEDKVWRKFRDSETATSADILSENYELMFDDGRVEIYRRKDAYVQVH